jgi:RNA polymerase sigma-32 factor
MRNDTGAATRTADPAAHDYSQWMREAPFLDEAQEQALADKWRVTGDQRAMNELVASHMRLIVKIARGYRGYGLPFDDLVSEGTVGFIQALRKFEPGHGARVATFARWWIRAAIHAYVLGNWSLVKIGTTASQRRLFFRLRSLKARLNATGSGDMSNEEVLRIAAVLGVPVADVIDMNRRLSGGDRSLNIPAGPEGDEPSLQDQLADDRDSQESELADRETSQLRRDLLAEAMLVLDPRERWILTERRLTEAPRSLESLAVICRISPSRVGQIENRAMAKIERAVKAGARRLRLPANGTPVRHVTVPPIGAETPLRPSMLPHAAAYENRAF